MISVSENLMRHMWPHGDQHIPGLCRAIAISSQHVFAKYGITTVLQVAHIMAQVSHECGAGHDIEENGNYSARRMTQVWPSRFPSLASALPYANNPRKLFNNTYGNRMGNRPGTDDGYNFRGRGGTQVTGREGYTKLSRKTGLDLVNQPDLVNLPDYFLECAVADFIICGCLPYCSAKPGLPNGDIRGVTHHLNGGYIGLNQRVEWFNRWLPAVRAIAPAAAPVTLLEPSGTEQEQVDLKSSPELASTDDVAEPADDGVLRYGRGHDAPDYEVKAVQELLVSKGYTVGKCDGDFGGGLRAAVLAAQADNGLPTTGEVDAATKEAFKEMPDKPISEERLSATAADLIEGGSVTVAKGQKLGTLGKIGAALGIGGGAAQQTGALEQAQSATEKVSMLRSVMESVQDAGHWALTHSWIFILVAAYLAYKYGGDIVRQRLFDHHNAYNMKQ